MSYSCLNTTDVWNTKMCLCSVMYVGQGPPEAPWEKGP